ARGPVRSVVLVAEKPFESVSEIALDTSSRTSVVLARLVLRRLFGKEPRLVGRPAAQAIAEARGDCGALVIGDPALAIEGKYPHVIDLGQAWLEWTGLPFVFAAWCGRPGAVSAEDERILLEAKAHGLARRDALADAHATNGDRAASS